MPCENCQTQFTVFRRNKRICRDCKLFYCINCIINLKRDEGICCRCAIFAKRPLLRDDLLQLKPKDLIFYLHAKNVSSAGCLEKDELIDLILSYVSRTDGNTYSPTDYNSPEEKANHSFENIKQSCQNFFSNITVGLTDSLSAMDARNKAKGESRRQATRYSTCDLNNGYIFEQPHVSRRPIPTYANSLNEQTQDARSAAVHNTKDFDTKSSVKQQVNCECSEDEAAAVGEKYSQQQQQQLNSSKKVTLPSEALTVSSNLEQTVIRNGEESSHSSFEELGAIGGISDDSKAATDTNSSSNTDQWQLLDKETPMAEKDDIDTPKQRRPDTLWRPPAPIPIATYRTKKVIRRRSDSYLNKRANSSDEESLTGEPAPDLQILHEQPETSAAASQQQQYCCPRCGKNKYGIKKQVEIMRQQFESSKMTEEDVKKELKELITYLEQHTKPMEYSRNENNGASCSFRNPEAMNGYINADALRTPTIEFSPTTEVSQSFNYSGSSNMNEDRVIAAAADSRFINLHEMEDFQDLKNLTVKQLKEVLTLHRVDYKGCFEKQEILERVELLRRTLRSAPAVESLASNELCKICMDAPIECVFLECGHMATCTNCGKVLNECPLCRQYIVRVVRFFRA